MNAEYIRKLALGHVDEFAVTTHVLLEASHGLKSQISLFCMLFAIARKQKLDLPAEFLRSLGETYKQACLEIQLALGQLPECADEFLDGEFSDAKASFDVVKPLIDGAHGEKVSTNEAC